MKEQIVRIDPEGRIIFMFHDDSPLRNLGGDLTVVRASNVRFDNSEKRWAVYMRFPDGTEMRLPETFANRAEAIAFEIETCEGILQRQPKIVEHMFTEGVVRDTEGRLTSG